MGDGPSKFEPSDGPDLSQMGKGPADPKDGGPAAKPAGLSAPPPSEGQTETAFEDAFLSDFKGIQSIVRELEAIDSSSATTASPERMKRIKAQEKAAQQQEQKLNRMAKERSEAWIKKASAQPVLAEASDDFFAPQPPKPKVYGWETAAMASFLQDPDIVAAWGDRHLGPLLRDLLDKLRDDPTGKHGIHPDLAVVLAKPNPAELLAAARAERERRPNVSAPITPDVTLPKYYQLLVVAVDATTEEIRKAYRKQALKWHPDKNRDNLDEANERFREITVAFDTLYDPIERERYDSGEANLPQKAKKLAGCGWANYEDEDEEVLAKAGLHLINKAWTRHHLGGGRIDDTEVDLISDRNDPGYPALRKKLFWRMIGELVYQLETSGEQNWMHGFILKHWKDTPSRWPKGEELKKLSETSAQEWKERRMVYNRRKQKIWLAYDLHIDYLNIPRRLEKEKARLQQMFPKTYNDPNIKWMV